MTKLLGVANSKVVLMRPGLLVGYEELEDVMSC
jgi:hypothetical protein